MNKNFVGVQLFDFSEKAKNEPMDVKTEAITPSKQSYQIAAIPVKTATFMPVKESTTSNFYCEKCNIYLNAKCIYEQHLAGRPHAKKAGSNGGGGSGLASILKNPMNNKPDVKKVEVAGLFTCEACAVSVPSKDQLDMHLKGKKHLAQVTGDKSFRKDSSAKNRSRQPKGDGTKNSAPKHKPSKVVEEPQRCETCDLSLVTKEQMSIHMIGKRHMKNLKAGGVVRSSTVSISDGTCTSATAKKPLTEEQFSHLNIAWDKYKVTNQLITEPAQQTNTANETFEFYCSMCKKFMQRKMQLVDHLKSKKHHKKIYDKRMEGSKEPTTVASLSKKFINKGLNKRPINFVPSSNAPTLGELKFGRKQPPFQNQNHNAVAFQQQPRFQNYNDNILNTANNNNTNNSYQQANQGGYSNYQNQSSSSNIQQGQATLKSAAIQYNNYGSYKRKSPGPNDNSFPGCDNHYDAKYRKNNDSMPIVNNSQPNTNYDNQMFNNNFSTQSIAVQNTISHDWGASNPSTNSNINQSNVNGGGGSGGGGGDNDYQNYYQKFNMFSNLNYMQYAGMYGQNPGDQKHNMNK